MSVLENGQKEYLSQNFSDLSVPRIEISAKEFDSCTFIDCDFSEFQVRNCKFIDCLFLRCNLSLARLGQSKFSDVVFEECKLVGVDWTQATWPKFELPSPIQFVQCILNDSSFFGLSLQELLLKQCKAHDVDFREGNFSDADFTYTDFASSLFNNTNLTRSDFTEATNYSIDVYYNEIKNAKFSRYEATRLLESLGIELVD